MHEIKPVSTGKLQDVCLSFIGGNKEQQITIRKELRKFNTDKSHIYARFGIQTINYDPDFPENGYQFPTSFGYVNNTDEVDPICNNFSGYEDRPCRNCGYDFTHHNNQKE